MFKIQTSGIKYKINKTLRTNLKLEYHYSNDFSVTVKQAGRALQYK